MNNGGRKNTADGVYDDAATHVMENVAAHNGSKAGQTDRNIFAWYTQVLPKQLPGVHVVDWGAGVGRFVHFFEARGVKKLTLVEPSSASFSSLNDHFRSRTHVELINGGIGSQIIRVADLKNTIHICNFVVNCVSSLSAAFEALATSILPGERLFVVTNVFAPKAVVDSIKDSRYENAVSIDIAAAPSPSLRLPTSQVFSNQIIASGEVLRDSVHTLAEYAELWRKEGTRWSTSSAKLMLPDGFQHKVMQDDDFGDYRFAVLVMELVRR